MVSLRFIAGASGIVVGFFIYQYGFFMTLNLSQGLFEWIVSEVPWIGSSMEVVGGMLQLLGMVLAVAGLLLCISWVRSQAREKAALGIIARTSQALAQLAPRTSQPKIEAVAARRTCKFCGAAMGLDAVFCPKCDRAQG
jgi:hypothetical protein